MWCQVLCSWQVLIWLWTQHAGDLTHIIAMQKDSSPGRLVKDYCVCVLLLSSWCFFWKDVSCGGMQLNSKVFSLYLMDLWVCYEIAEMGNFLKSGLHDIILFGVDTNCPESKWPDRTSGSPTVDIDFSLKWYRTLFVTYRDYLHRK